MTADSVEERQRERRADIALAQRCRDGDESARTQLVKRHLDQVRITLFRIIGPNQEMPDLIQNALVEVLRSLRHYRGDALLRTWVDRVCANVAYQYLRRRRGPAPMPLELVPELPSADQAESMEGRLQGKRLITQLNRLMDRLSPRKRIALTLHAILGYSVKEVAALTDSTVPTTKSRIQYGRRELLRLARNNPELRAWLDEG